MSYPLRNKIKVPDLCLPDVTSHKMRKINKNGRTIRHRRNCHECFESFASDLDYDSHLQRCQIKYIQKVKQYEKIYENHLKSMSSDSAHLFKSLKLIPHTCKTNLEDVNLSNSQYDVKNCHYLENIYNESHSKRELNNDHKLLKPIMYHNFNKDPILVTGTIQQGHCNNLNIKDMSPSFPSNVCNFIDYPPSPLWIKGHHNIPDFNGLNIPNYKKVIMGKYQLKQKKYICISNSVKEPRYLNNINLTSLLYHYSFDKYINYFQKHLSKHPYSNQVNLHNHEALNYDLYNEKNSYVSKEFFQSTHKSNELHYYSKFIHDNEFLREPLTNLINPKYEKYCERYNYSIPDQLAEKKNTSNLTNCLVECVPGYFDISHTAFKYECKISKPSNAYRINGMHVHKSLKDSITVRKFNNLQQNDPKYSVPANDFLFSALNPSLYSEYILRKYLPCIQIPTAEKFVSYKPPNKINLNPITYIGIMNHLSVVKEEINEFINSLHSIYPKIDTYTPSKSICMCCFYQVKPIEGSLQVGPVVIKPQLVSSLLKIQSTKTLAIKKKYSSQNIQRKRVKYDITKSPTKLRSPSTLSKKERSPKKSPAKGKNVVKSLHLSTVLIDLTRDEVIRSTNDARYPNPSDPKSTTNLAPLSHSSNSQKHLAPETSKKDSYTNGGNVLYVDLTHDTDSEVESYDSLESTYPSPRPPSIDDRTQSPSFKSCSEGSDDHSDTLYNGIVPSIPGPTHLTQNQTLPKLKENISPRVHPPLPPPRSRIKRVSSKPVVCCSSSSPPRKCHVATCPDPRKLSTCRHRSPRGSGDHRHYHHSPRNVVKMSRPGQLTTTTTGKRSRTTVLQNGHHRDTCPGKERSLPVRGRPSRFSGTKKVAPRGHPSSPIKGTAPNGPVHGPPSQQPTPEDCHLLLHCHLCSHKESFASQDDIQEKIAYHCSNRHKNVQFYIDMSEVYDDVNGYDVILVECHPS